MKKNTKKSLLFSILALVLCTAMLLGTTFAWFTDSASTAVNKIEAGTLKVDMVDESGHSIADEPALRWKKAADAPTGEQVLWEPGCTYELPEFKVVNKGNLALNYTLSINGVQGSAKLLDAIEFTVKVGDTVTALDGLKGKLVPNEQSEFITISGHMKESAGNVYQGLSLDGIAISLNATQASHEYDSFNNTYDGDAYTPVSATATGNLDVTETSTQNNAVVSGEQTISDGVMTVTYPDGIKLSTTDDVTGTTEKKTSIEQKLEYVGETASEELQNNNSITIGDGKAVAQYKLTLPVAQDNTTLVKIKINYAKNLTGVQVYHNGTLLITTESDTNEYFTYNPTTGELTLYLKHASPIDIVYDAVAVKEVPVATVTFANGTTKQYLASEAYTIPEEIGNDGANWTNEYKALSCAFYDVARTGGTVVINQDLTFGENDHGGLEMIGDYTESTVKTNRFKKAATVNEAVLDLAGHSIEFAFNEESATYGNEIYMANINVTIKDTSAAKTGKISSHCLSVLCHLGNVVLRVESGTFLTDCVNGSIHGIGIMKGGDYVYDDEANKFVPGQVSMTGGTLSYADAMNEANSITHKTYLQTFIEQNVAEGYTGTFDAETGCITVTAK